MELEHRAVGGGGPVEGDLRLGGPGRVGHGLLGLAGDDEARVRHGQVLPGLAGLGRSPFERRDGHLAEIAIGGEPVHDHPVAGFTGHLGHEFSDRRQHDLRVPVLVGPGVEERGHQRVGVEVAPEVELGPVGPAIPDGPDGEQHLAHPRSRV